MERVLDYTRSRSEKSDLLYYVLSCALSIVGTLCAVLAVVLALTFKGEMQERPEVAAVVLMFWAGPLWLLSGLFGLVVIVLWRKREGARSRFSLALNNVLWLANLMCVAVLVWLL